MPADTSVRDAGQVLNSFLKERIERRQTLKYIFKDKKTALAQIDSAIGFIAKALDAAQKSDVKNLLRREANAWGRLRELIVRQASQKEIEEVLDAIREYHQAQKTLV